MCFLLFLVVFQALREAQASELASRMTAMSAASNNAEEMINTLTIDYNKARQGAITQELIEIVVDSKGIVDYAGGLIITDKDSRLRDPNSLLAVYYPNRKLIAVYLDAIEEMLKSYNTYQEMFSSTEELFYKNLLVT